MDKRVFFNQSNKYRIVTFCFCFIVLLCLSSITTTASSRSSISCDVVVAKPSDTVDVSLVLVNNPGIVSATIKVDFDSSVLTLTKVTDGGLLGVQSHKPEKTSPYTLAWVNDTATKNYTSNGTIVTLSFKVSKSADYGKSYPISISYNYNNYDIFDKDLKIKNIQMVAGAVKITKSHSIVLGDVNRDKRVTIDDLHDIQEVVAYVISNEKIENVAADVDEDGDTNILDVTHIQRYLSSYYVPYPIGKTIE